MKQLFYFYGYRLKVLRWHKNTVVAANIFEPNEDGFAAFREFIKDYKHLKTQLLVDIIEEDFHSDNIPRVSGKDRQALINRSLNNNFKDITYRCALSHGKSATEKGKEEILVGALTNTELLTPWLSEIRRQGIRLTGIQSVSTVGETLLSKIQSDEKPILLISQQLPWTIRFSFYKDNNLYFSRLIPTRLNDISEFPGVVLNEIDSTLRYLQYKRLITETDNIDTTIILAEEYAEHLNKSLAGLTQNNYKVFTVPEVAETIGIKKPLESTTADIIFAHVAQLKPKNRYGRDDDLLSHKSHNFKNTLYGITAALAITGISFSAFLGINSSIFNKNAHDARVNTEIFQKKYEKQSMQLNELLDNAEIMKQSVDAVAKLTRDESYTPAFVLEQFSHVLAGYPQIQLDRLKISYDSGYLEPDPSNPASMEPSLEPIDPAYPKPIIRIDASLIGMDKDYRDSLKLVAKFKEDLQKVYSITDVEITKQPVEITPKTQFSGNTGAAVTSSEKQSNTNKFSIKITFDRNMPDQKNQNNNYNAFIESTSPVKEANS